MTSVFVVCLGEGRGFAYYRTRAKARKVAAALREHYGGDMDPYAVKVLEVAEGQGFGGSDCANPDVTKILADVHAPPPPGVVQALEHELHHERHLSFRNENTRDGVVFERGGGLDVPPTMFKRFEGRAVTKEEMFREIFERFSGDPDWALAIGERSDPRLFGPVRIRGHPAPPLHERL